MIKKITETLKQLSIPTAVTGTVAVFLGWRATAAYLLTFGIDTDWMELDIIQFMINGWIEVLLLFAILFGLFYSDFFGKKILGTMSDRISTALLRVSFIGLVVYTTFVVVTYYPGNADLYQYAMTYAPLIILWWFFVVQGEYVHRKKAYPSGTARSWLDAMLGLIFETRHLAYLLTAGFVFFFVVNFASVRGTFFANRDKTAGSHLPIVSVITKTPLMIPEETLLSFSGPNEFLYQYPNLRLITQTQDHLFVFRLDEIDTRNGAAQIYIIPLENIEVINARQWFWSAAALTPATPTNVSSPAP